MAKILVVDDEMGIRELLSEILSDEGHSVSLAENAAEARRVRGEMRPDLVLLDVNMPGMDGIGVLKEITKADPDAIVVMLTSLTSRHMIQQAVELGASNYIRKDTPKEEILAALQELIHECFEQ